MCPACEKGIFNIDEQPLFINTTSANSGLLKSILKQSIELPILKQPKLYADEAILWGYNWDNSKLVNRDNPPPRLWPVDVIVAFGCLVNIYPICLIICCSTDLYDWYTPKCTWQFEHVLFLGIYLVFKNLTSCYQFLASTVPLQLIMIWSYFLEYPKNPDIL